MSNESQPVPCFNAYLVRHGKPDAPAALYGKTDVSVSEQTQQQIAAHINDLDLGVSQIITSPLSRCQALASLLCQQSVGCQLVVDPALQEMNFGDFDGVPFDKLAAEWPTLEAFWQQPAEQNFPGAETLAHFNHRVTQAWRQRIKQLSQHTMIVCHGGTIRMILADILGIDWRQPALYSNLSIDYQSITHLRIFPGSTPFISVRAIGIPTA